METVEVAFNTYTTYATKVIVEVTNPTIAITF